MSVTRVCFIYLGWITIISKVYLNNSTPQESKCGYDGNMEVISPCNCSFSSYHFIDIAFIATGGYQYHLRKDEI